MIDPSRAARFFRFNAAVCAVFLSASPGLAGSPAGVPEPVAIAATAAPSQPPLNPLFSDVVPRLKREMTVPVRLPATLYTNGVTLVADSNHHDSLGYTVVLMTQTGCPNGCMYGAIVAAPREAHKPSAFHNARKVSLANGQTAYIFSPCDTSCDVPNIMWTEGSQEYGIFMKGKVSDRQFVEMANSMTTY